MVLTMNAYKGWFNREHLAKVVAAQGLSVFNRELDELVDAILREGGIEVAFAPRYAQSSAAGARPRKADQHESGLDRPPSLPHGRVPAWSRPDVSAQSDCLPLSRGGTEPARTSSASGWPAGLT